MIRQHDVGNAASFTNTQYSSPLAFLASLFGCAGLHPHEATAKEVMESTNNSRQCYDYTCM
ncbi:hypothetical protein E2C01_024680 [Portunus trituberculatus]|uniref:Uncharacterized protein n=1 Tax=Portunus trituberculatus TaxID=210409 RepID=A0A5B7EBG0_PORTR|nr:hypothetical protein [Portunus trituberculatus]